MFDASPLLIFLTALLFLFAFLSVTWTGGLRNNVFHFFIIFIQFFYFFNSPAHFYQIERWTAYYTDVRNYFSIGFLQIFLHLLFYLIGYAVFSRKASRQYQDLLAEKIPYYRKVTAAKIVTIFIVLFLIIFLNTLSVGINLIDVVRGKFETATMGLKGSTYFLQNFADSLIMLLVAAYYFKVKKMYFLLMLVFAFVLFMILGFRYRILLTIFGFFMVYVVTKKIKWTMIVKYLAILLTGFYFLMFITFNRIALYTQQYEYISYDPNDFDYETIYNEAFGSMVDFAMYKSYDDGQLKNDYGQTMFGIIVVRIIPARFFPNGEKPYPPPQLLAIDEALGVDRNYGQASTAIGALFFAFYYPGIYLGAFCLGLLVGKLQSAINGRNVFAPLFGIAIVLAVFQWLTRGYLPQVIDHLVYLIFPIFVLRWLVKRDKKFNLATNPIV